jgi:hypothetical protein
VEGRNWAGGQDVASTWKGGTGQGGKMLHHRGREEQKSECVLHQQCNTRNWEGRKVVASTWKGGANERVCVASLMQHYGNGKVDEMLQHHGRAEQTSECVASLMQHNGTGKVDEMLQHRGRVEEKG